MKYWQTVGLAIAIASCDPGPVQHLGPLEVVGDVQAPPMHHACYDDDFGAVGLCIIACNRASYDDGWSLVGSRSCDFACFKSGEVIDCSTCAPGECTSAIVDFDHRLYPSADATFADCLATGECVEGDIIKAHYWQ